MNHRVLFGQRGRGRHGISRAKWPVTNSHIVKKVTKTQTSIELNGFPLYASANSVASAGLVNLISAIDLLGAKSLRKSNIDK